MSTLLQVTAKYFLLFGMKKPEGKRQNTRPRCGYGRALFHALRSWQHYHSSGFFFENATFIQWDFSKGLPKSLLEQRYYYDYVISTYALHHVNEEKQVEILSNLAPLLKPQGTALIGDISFESRLDLVNCRNLYGSLWDDEEFYFVAEEVITPLSSVYDCQYKQISHCAGVFVLKSLQVL